MLEFWYEFASTFSYLSAMRVEALAAAAGASVVRKPFLLGLIFSAQGWDTSPFNLYPAKGRNRVRTWSVSLPIEAAPLPCRPFFHRTFCLQRGWRSSASTRGGSRLSRGVVFEAEFAQGADIADARLLDTIVVVYTLILRGFCRASPDLASRRAPSSRQPRHARHLRGSVVDLSPRAFLGDDRLEQALAWAARP